MTRVRYHHEDGVSMLTLCSDSGTNAVDPELVAQLAAAVRRARADDAHVVVLRAEGRAFCVGGDVVAFGAAEDMTIYIDDLAEGVHRAILDLQALEAVVVTVVHGAAAGAGFPLAAAADLVIAGESARFSMAYTKIGLSPDGGSTLLTATLGLHRTLQLALLNTVLTAQDAARLGLVAQVVPDEQLRAAADEVVAVLRAGSRQALVSAKRVIRAQATPVPEVALRREAVAIRTAAATSDAREGITAFAERRTPTFASSQVRPTG